MSSIISSVSTPLNSSALLGTGGRAPHAAEAAAQAPLATPAQAPPGPDGLQKLVEAMQTKALSAGSDLQFTVDQESGKSIVKVTERSSKDVIWQFPSEQALQVTKELDRFRSMLSRRA